MGYNKAAYSALVSAKVPKKIALSLADDSSPIKVIVPQPKQTDLNTGTATATQIATQLNALEALLVTAGVLK